MRMTDITIPPAALEAGARALAIAKEGNDEWWTLHMRAARAAFFAIVENWEGKDIVGYGPPFYGIDLILPLPPAGDQR